MSRNSTREQQQFEKWIEQHHAALYRHALWMTGQADVANDCVQETYYQAWRSRKSMKDASRVLAWLLTILRRMVYREYGHRSQNAKLMSTVTDELADTGVSDDHSDMLDLIEAMRGLSGMHREVILLYALHGLSYQEISTVLDIPAGTVMSRISRARCALEKALQQEPQQDAHAGVVSLKVKRQDRNE